MICTERPGVNEAGTADAWVSVSGIGEQSFAAPAW
jgi:hypothetical protein